MSVPADVAAFLERRLGFLDIAAVVAEVLAAMGPTEADDLAAVIARDTEARRLAANVCVKRFADAA